MKSNGLWFFLCLFLMVGGELLGQNSANIPPSYEYIDQIDLPDFTIGQLNTDDITVAITTDQEGNIYTLSFGNGVSKRNAEGEIDENFKIPASALSSPLDIAVNLDGEIFIADYSETACSQNGKIKVFDQSGQLTKIIYTQFYRPIGLDISDEGNIYVAEYNAEGSGCESDELSRVSIYNPAGSRIKSTNNVNRPFRIAVNSKGKVYVSQAGINNISSVRIFDEQLIFQEILPNIQSPGSVVIDKFDFIHVIEYAGRIDFRQFLNFEEVDIGDLPEILELSKQIYLGQENNDFGIKIFNPNGSFESFYKNQINFPVDLAINNCNKMYVNNSKILGNAVWNPFNGNLISFFPSKLEFDLKVYQRTPSLDTKAPVAICIAPGKEFTLVNGLVTINPEDIDNGSTDNCSISLSVSPSTFTTTGTKTVTLTATDAVGNEDTCQTTIEILNPPPPPNSAPDANKDAYTIGQDETLNITAAEGVLKNDTDVDGDSLTATLVTATTNGTLTLDPNGSFIYIPNPGYSGTDSFTYFANDGEDNSTTATVTITVTAAPLPPNSAPDAINDAYTTGQDETLNITAAEGVLKNDTDVDGDSLTATVVTTTTNGTLTLDSDGSFIYIPNPGYSGTDSFTYFANDGEDNSTTATVTITVTAAPPPPNSAPNANNDEYETFRNETLTVSEADGVLQNDTDPENNALTATLLRNVSAGTLTFQPDGSFLYVPENMFTGVVSFSYVATDGVNNSAETVVSIVVLPPQNNIPVATDDNYITTKDVTLNISAENGVLVNDYDADGEELEAEISVLPTNGTVTLFPDGSFTYIPDPGYVGEDFFTYTIEDRYGFFAEAVVNITIEDDSTPPPNVEITCAGDQTRSLNESCEFLVPDLTSLATATEGAVITQSPAEGSIISENLTIRLTATLEGETDFCEFQLFLVDTVPPQITCLQDQIENYDPAVGFEVPDYTGMLGESDNCGVVEVTQSPAAGTIIYESKDIRLTATDQAENSVECTFKLSLTEEEVLEISCIPDQQETLNANCQFIVPDYTDQASVNNPDATVTQSPAAGEIITGDTTVVLTASLDGETDVCEFKILLDEDTEAPNANCILTGIFELNPNGTLSISAEQIEFGSTDNCGIAGITIDKSEFTSANLGENVITVTVTDTAGNEDTCQTTITIVPKENSGTEFTCLSQTTLELDASGNATLRAADLYTGDPGNRSFTFNKENFNCSNIGSNSVTLSFTGTDGSGSCEINVEVVDRINPVLLTNNINVRLDAQGRATISPQLINNGSYDNCGEITFSLNKNTFSCKDIGENIISLRGEDSSGNISTVTATVFVTGNCNGIPDNPVDYIYIYPNPTPGPFTFAVPQGWIIEKAEVFDSRGRYLLTQSFEERASYSMDLTGFQDAVYILLLYTNEGKKIVRVIIH